LQILDFQSAICNPKSAMSYSESYFIARESWRDWRIEAQQLMNLARVSKGTRVLEIGCGGGGLLRLLRARGADAVGVDTLEVALNVANVSLRGAIPLAPPARAGVSGVKRSRRTATKQSPHCAGDCFAAARLAMTHENPRSSAAIRVPLIRIGQDRALPFRDAAFDAVVGQHVIEHPADADAALREWNRLLKPGGRLALATPNADYPDHAHFADADHAHIFSPRELSDAATRAGFAVEACYTIFPFLSRVRVLRALGVIGYRVFQHAPYFATRGRTILLSAVRP